MDAGITAAMDGLRAAVRAEYWKRLREGSRLIDSAGNRYPVHPSRKRYSYVLNPPLAVDDVQDFETKHGIQLPNSYRRFVTEVGNGLIGWESPLEPLHLCTRCDGHCELSRSFPLDEDWNEQDHDWPDDPNWDPQSGTVPISSSASGDRKTLLVVNGPHSGEVWSHTFFAGNKQYACVGRFNDGNLPDLDQLHVVGAADRAHEDQILLADAVESDSLTALRQQWVSAFSVEAFSEWPMPESAHREWYFIDQAHERMICEFHVDLHVPGLNSDTVSTGFTELFGTAYMRDSANSGSYIIGQSSTSTHLVTAGWDGTSGRVLLHVGTSLVRIGGSAGESLRTRGATVPFVANER